MPDIDTVRRMMDTCYAAGTAYNTTLPFDSVRGRYIHSATLTLARNAYPQRELPSTLDVGSGEGGIASFWPHQQIVGVELSAVAVRMAKERYPEVDYRCSAIEEFRLLDGEPRFSLAVAQESIEHWVDVPAGLSAIREAMVPGGTLVLTTPNRDSLHCRISRKLGLGEPPKCSDDHVHEFGFNELIATVERSGFRHADCLGVVLLPYWAMERVLGHEIRRLTDTDQEVCEWFAEIGSLAPAEYCFIQCHAFVRS